MSRVFFANSDGFTLASDIKQTFEKKLNFDKYKEKMDWLYPVDDWHYPLVGWPNPPAD